MSYPLISQIGAYIKAFLGVAPVAHSGTTAVNGAGIDRSTFASGVLVVTNGATSGSPTSFTVTGKVQDSADNSSFADYKPDGTNVASLVNSTAGSTAQLDVDLATARQYIRVVTTPAFVAGTSPTVIAGANLVLGGSDTLPV